MGYAATGWLCAPCERLSLSRSPGYLNKEIFLFPLRDRVIESSHGAAGDGDDRQGNWVSLCDGADLFSFRTGIAKYLGFAMPIRIVFSAIYGAGFGPN